MKLVFAASLIASAFAVPDLSHNWSADVTITEDGNISGVRPGVTNMQEWYAEDWGMDHYYYPETSNHKHEVYRYNDKDAKTGCGIVYQYTDKKCCQAPIVDSSGTCQAWMGIQVAKKAQDMGLTDNGEHWHQEFNHFGIDQNNDWFVNADGHANAYNQYITIGGDGANPQWVSFNQDYANVSIATVTEADFAIPEGCTASCNDIPVHPRSTSRIAEKQFLQ